MSIDEHFYEKGWKFLLHTHTQRTVCVMSARKVTVLWKVVVFSFKNFHTPASRRDESSSPRELSPCSPEIWFEWVIIFPSHAGSGSEGKWRKGNGNVLTGGYQGNVSLAQKTPEIRKNEHRVLSRLERNFRSFALYHFGLHCNIFAFVPRCWGVSSSNWIFIAAETLRSADS